MTFTAWSEGRRTLTFTWCTQSDRIALAHGRDGRTRQRISRGGATLTDTNRLPQSA